MNSEKVIELARESGITRQLAMEVPFVVNSLERFAALIEAEVRGDAEPVAYETVQELWAADDPDINEWIRQNGRPLYAHPAPAVVAQLVEAAKRAMNYAENVVMAEGVYFDHDDDLPFIESALAAAKETGI